jgi:hypothetical protein
MPVHLGNEIAMACLQSKHNLSWKYFPEKLSTCSCNVRSCPFLLKSYVIEAVRKYSFWTQIFYHSSILLCCSFQSFTVGRRDKSLAHAQNPAMTS